MPQAHDKRIISLRYWLIGREFFRATEALEMALEHHTGVRKDGVTPEIDHPVTVAQYLRTLVSGLLYPEDTLIAALCHDLCEDYEVEPEDIRRRFGDRAADAVWALTKTFRGEDRPLQTVYADQARDPVASLVKGADRIHNVGTMVGVFDQAKQADYVAEAEDQILPMIKKARRRFPRQEEAYENIKLVLRGRIYLIRAMHEAAA